MHYIDFLSVFIATLAYLLIVFFWYLSFRKNYGNFSKKLFFPVNFFIGFIFSFIFEFIQIRLEVTSFKDGIYSGFFIWLGFILPMQLSSFFWYKSKNRVIFLEIFRMFITSLIIGGILVG